MTSRSTSSLDASLRSLKF